MQQGYYSRSPMEYHCPRLRYSKAWEICGATTQNMMLIMCERDQIYLDIETNLWTLVTTLGAFTQCICRCFTTSHDLPSIITIMINGSNHKSPTLILAVHLWTAVVNKVVQCTQDWCDEDQHFVAVEVLPRQNPRCYSPTLEDQLQWQRRVQSQQ